MSKSTMSRCKKKYSLKSFESELLNCVNHLVEALPNKNTDEFSDDFFNEMLITEQHNNLDSPEEMTSEQMLNEVNDTTDFSGFLDFSKVENAHFQLLDAFNKEDTDINSIDELIDSVKFYKDKCEKSDSEKSKGKSSAPIIDYTVEKGLKCRSQANVIKSDNKLKQFSCSKYKKKNSGNAKYRAELNRCQNNLWNVCLPYIDVQEFKSSLDFKIVSKAVIIVNNIKTHHRLLLEERKKLKLTQMKLLQTLINKLKTGTEMPVKRKRKRRKNLRWVLKKSSVKVPSTEKLEYFKGFSSSDFPVQERYSQLLASLEGKKSCSSTDTGDEATFSGFDSSDDEAGANDFFGFNNSTSRGDALGDLFSRSPCSSSFKFGDSIPELEFIFPPLTYSKVTENVPMVKNSHGTPVKKGMKRKHSDSIQVLQLTDLGQSVQNEYISKPLIQSAAAHEFPIISVKSDMVRKVAKVRVSLNTIPSRVYEKKSDYDLQSFMVKSETNNKNSLKMKIIRNAETRDSDAKKSQKRIKREIKHPGKYAAYIIDGLKTNNTDLTMLKVRLPIRKGKLQGNFTSKFVRNKETLTVDQEPKILDAFSATDPVDVKKENTSPSTDVNAKCIKSTSVNAINGNNQLQRQALDSFSGKNKNYVKRNKPIECPSLLKEIKENQIILADKLACLKDILLKRNGCEVSIRKLDGKTNVKHDHLNKKSNCPNFKYAKSNDNSAQMCNVANDRCLNRGNSVLELNRQILKKGITDPRLPTSFPSDDNVSKNCKFNKKAQHHHHQQSDVIQKNISSVTTEDDHFTEQQKKSIANGFCPTPPLYSSNVKRDYSYRTVPQATSTPKPLPKMPTLIPYYSLTSGNIGKTILSKTKLPKLTNAINMQKKAHKADFESLSSVDLPYAKLKVAVDLTSERICPVYGYSFSNQKIASTKFCTQDSNVLLAPDQVHSHLHVTKHVESFGETDYSNIEDKDSNISPNVVKPPILQKQHKCSNCDFVTTKLGVFKRHQLSHSEANSMAKADNNKLPKHTSPVKEITPVRNEEMNVESIKASSASLKAQNHEQRVKSLFMPLKDVPTPLLPHERLFLKSWTRIEKLELMWCYYYSCCNVLTEGNVVSRLQAALSKRGKIRNEKSSSDCLLKIVFSILSGNKIRAHDLYPIKINAEITARKEHLNSIKPRIS